MPAGILRPVSGIRVAGLGMAEGTGSRLEDLAAAPCSQEEHWELLAEDCGAALTGIGGLATVRATDPVFLRGGRVGCARGERPGFLDAENRLQVGDSFFTLEGFFPAVTRPALADPFLSLLRSPVRLLGGGALQELTVGSRSRTGLSFSTNVSRLGLGFPLGLGLPGPAAAFSLSFRAHSSS